jgi:hypothetical protein
MLFPSTPSPQLETNQQACCVPPLSLHRSQNKPICEPNTIWKIDSGMSEMWYMEAGHEAMVLQNRFTNYRYTFVVPTLNQMHFWFCMSIRTFCEELSSHVYKIQKTSHVQKILGSHHSCQDATDSGPPEISKVALQFSNASSPVISHNHHRSSSLGKDSVMELRF